MEPGVYTMTVVNPDGISATLPSAFTVTNGIGVWTTGGPYGGHISQIRIHPDTPTTVFAVALQIGIFVSYDAGANWEPFLMESIFEGIEFDADDRDIIYLGGNQRTMDGGQTWETLTIHTPIPFKGWNYRLTADPVQAGRLYAAASTPHAGITGGILRSDNYGETGSWITLTEGVSDTQFMVVAVHPTDNDTLLAGTESGNLYYSQNGGQDWHWAAQIENAVSKLFFNPYEPLEAWVTAPPEVAGSPYLYKSTNLSTWVPVDIDPSQIHGAEGWSLAFLQDKIWAGAWGVYSSTNGGDSWTPTDCGGAMSLDVHPDRPQEIYLGDFTNGVFKSADDGYTWQESSEGLSGVNPSAILVAPDDPETVYVKIDPALFKSENGGQSWRSLNFGGGGFPARTKLAIDPFQPERLYFGHECPDSTCLWISDDGGESWISVTATLPVTYTAWEGAFYTLAPHPDVPGRILAGVEIWPSGSAFWIESEGLFLASDEYGVTWNHLGPTEPISRVSEIAFDAIDPNLIYAGTHGTGLWKSTDGGQNWEKTSSPAGLEIIDTIATHPEFGETVYVSAGDDLGGPDCGLYVSYDAGDNWTFLPGGGGGQLLFVPTIPPTLYGLYSGQFSGLVRSTDGGQSWQHMVDAPIPISLATGSDGERVVLYIGSAGGMVTQAGTQAVSSSNAVRGQSTIFGGGVYRLTTILPTDWVYLPLVLRGHTP
jgi:photosystem II stability/assembly factor-like uncharacterized protein